MSKKYFASQLMKVDVDKLIKDINPLEERPDYKPEIFNMERHIKLDLPSREVVDNSNVIVPEIPIVRKSTRERKKPDRLTYK